jgi:hypothetical protein
VLARAPDSVKTWISGGEGVGVMELGGEDRDLAPVIQRLGAPSIAQIERLIGELQETKNYLESEGERIQGEMVRYLKFTQLAAASVKIIF